MVRSTRLLLGLLFASVAMAQDEGPEPASDPARQFLEAWFSLEDPEGGEEAEAIFRAIASREDVDEDLRIRAELGLARVEARRGKRVEARVRLEKLLDRTANRPKLRRAVLDRLGQPRWLHEVRVIMSYPNAPTYLDLDTGGLFPEPPPAGRGEPEMRATEFLVNAELDAEFAKVAPPMCQKPWHRLRTDQGNVSWVQILATAPQPIVRFITRVGGHGDILPAPTDPFCIGYNSKIEVWWHPDPAYRKYQVERREGVDGSWHPAGEFERPPFIDRDVKVGERYGYRIAGVTAQDIVGLPVSLQGTVRSRGVVSGRVELSAQSRFDFLVGDSVSSGFDIQVYNVWPQAAMIYTHLQAPVQTIDENPDLEEPRSPWDTAGGGNGQVKSGDVFLVPLKGGGVARCTLTIKPTSNTRRWTALLEYEAYGDADIFPPTPEIETEETDEGVRIRARAAAPYRISQAEVREIRAGRGPWVVPLDENGEGLDTAVNSRDIREYSVVAVDAHGRRTLPGRARVNRMPDEPVAGEFQFRFQQGYSIVETKLAALHDSDIYFQAVQGNIHRIQFHSNYGMVHVGGMLDWDTSNVSEEEIFERVAGVDAEKLTLAPGVIRTNSGQKGESVLIARTKYGGWVKFWVADRGTSGNWNQRDIKMRYVYNPRSPTFVKGASDLTHKGGVLFSGLGRIEEYTRVTKSWTEAWEELQQDAEFRRRVTEIDPAGGAPAEAAQSQQVILEQHSTGNNPLRARYSFSLGRRDPPDGVAAKEEDWDVQWRGDRLYALPADGNAGVHDLGRLHWSSLREEGQLVPWASRSASPRFGHMYFCRRLEGPSFGPPTLMRVTAFEPRQRLQLEWVSLRDDKLVASPGLDLPEATRERLRELLAAVPASDTAGLTKRLGGEKAFDAYGRLHARKIPSVGGRDRALAELMPEFELVTDLPVVLEGDIGSRRVSFLRREGPAADLLHDVCDDAGIEWRIDAEGRLRLRPKVLTESERSEMEEAEQRRKARLEEERRRRIEEERQARLAELEDVRDALRAAIAELESGSD